MDRVVVFLFLLVLAAGAGAQERQRVAAVPPAQQWEAGLEGVLTPLGSAWWAASVAPRLGYEWEKTWSVSLSQPYSWLSDPERSGLLLTRGGTTLELGWSVGGADLRGRLALGRELPNGEGATGNWRGEAGLSAVRDPVILGGSLGIFVPDRGSFLQGNGSLFFQEVVNDQLTWSLVFSPQATWMEGVLFWTVSVAWRVGWYEGPYSVSSGVSAGSGLPWSWSASASRVWPR